MFESQALVPPDPDKDTEDWPLLELSDATVTLPTRRASQRDLVDLFDVSELGPFRVKGCLGKIPRRYQGIGR